MAANFVGLFMRLFLICFEISEPFFQIIVKTTSFSFLVFIHKKAGENEKVCVAMTTGNYESLLCNVHVPMYIVHSRYVVASMQDYCI